MARETPEFQTGRAVLKLMENWVGELHPSLPPSHWMEQKLLDLFSFWWKFPSDFFQGIPGPPGQKGDEVSGTVREHLTSSGAIILIFPSLFPVGSSRDILELISPLSFALVLLRRFLGTFKE